MFDISAIIIEFKTAKLKMIKTCFYGLLFMLSFSGCLSEPTDIGALVPPTVDQNNKKLLITVFIILITCITRPLLSQTDDKYFILGFNSDAFAGMEAGYAQNPGILKEKNLLIYVRFSIPLLLSYQDKSLDSWEIKAGVQSELFRKGNWATIGDVQIFLIHHRQILGSFLPMSTVKLYHIYVPLRFFEIDSDSLDKDCLCVYYRNDEETGEPMYDPFIADLSQVPIQYVRLG